MKHRAHAILVILTACLPACDNGNSASGKLMLSGSATGDLNSSLNVELLKWKKPVSLRMAPGTTFDVYVDEPEARTSVALSTVSVDGEIATAKINAAGVVRVTALKSGETNLRIKGLVDGKSIEDTMPLVIKVPDTLEISTACSDSELYWAGHPAVIRYEFREEPLPGGSGLDGRIFGSSFTPMTSKPAQSLLYANGFEWVFSGLELPGEVSVTGTLPADSTKSPLMLQFEDSPTVAGLGLMSMGTGGVLGANLQGPVGTKHVFRVFPVGQAGEQMCNTTAAARVDATTDGCVVRALEVDSSVFGPRADSGFGVFEVATSKPVGGCSFQITLGREGWNFGSDNPIRSVLTTSYFSVN